MTKLPSILWNQRTLDRQTRQTPFRKSAQALSIARESNFTYDNPMTV
jgi:hypothetical protein